MSAPQYNPLQAFRRFVGLRSAWRRSLALEPGKTAPPSSAQPSQARGQGGPQPSSEGRPPGDTACRRQAPSRGEARCRAEPCGYRV